MDTLANTLFIFFARIIDVSLATFRVLMLMRGERVRAAFTGFFEVSIYILALGRVVQHLNEPWKIIAYALGFSCGTIAGGWLEERLAVGYNLVQVIPKTHSGKLISLLRENNFGVTVLEGQGRSGPRYILNITTRRKEIPRLLALLEETDPRAFVTIFDARRTQGGFIVQDKKK
mgnify:CR=1 FL=1|jgi:uncharacterized protein YebE (UPF0316 family)